MRNLEVTLKQSLRSFRRPLRVPRAAERDLSQGERKLLRHLKGETGPVEIGPFASGEASGLYQQGLITMDRIPGAGCRVQLTPAGQEKVKELFG